MHTLHVQCTCTCTFNLVQAVYNRTLTSFMLIFSGKILQIVAHDADNSQPQAPNSSSPPKPDTDNSQPQACLPPKPTGPQSSAGVSRQPDSAIACGGPGQPGPSGTASSQPGPSGTASQPRQPYPLLELSSSFSSISSVCSLSPPVKYRISVSPTKPTPPH